LLTYMGTHSATASQPKSILDTAGEKSSNKTSGAPGAAGSNKPAPGVTSTPAAPAASGTSTPTPAPATPAAPVGATPPVTQPEPATPTQGPSPK